jgi:hypothetical protein
MRGADGDEDAGFANFQAAEAVGDGDTVDGEFFVDLGADFVDLGEGHGFVGFVVEIERGAAVRVVANAAVEGDDRAVFGGADVANQGRGVDGLANEGEEVGVGWAGHAVYLAAAHGRQERDFVAGMERRAPSGKFLVARGDYGSAETRELGMAGGVASEESFDKRAFGEVDGVFGAADNFLEAAEEEHLDADR